MIERLRASPLTRLAPTAAFAVVAWFYLWIASSSGNAFVWEGEKNDFYNLLADGFRAGHLHLNVEPDPRLLALSDPRDPQLNAPYRLHDASLHNGRYYLYFGPVPALVAFLPYNAVASGDLPPNFAAAAFTIAGFLFSCLLLRTCFHLLGVRTTRLTYAAAVIVLGLCQFAPYILRRPAHYEVAGASAFAFYSAGIWLLISSLQRERRPLLALAAFGLGLSSGCRPIYAVGVIAAWVLCMAYLAGRRQWGAALLFTLPVAGCAAALMWYNYARFNDPFEFGVSYQLGVSHLPVRLSMSSVTPAFYYFFVAPVYRGPEFPWWHVVYSPPFGDPAALRNLSYFERMAGLIAVFPVYVLGLTPVIAYAAAWRRGPAYLLSVALMHVPTLMVILALLATGFATMRYMLDFAPMLLVLTIAQAVLLIARVRRRMWRWALVAAIAVLSARAAAINVALSFTGPYGDMEIGNPEGYRKVANLFGAGWSELGGLETMDIGARARFPASRAAQPEALLSSGRVEGMDIVYVRYLPPSAVVFGLYSWGRPAAESSALTIDERERSLRIRYSDKTLRLEIDGREVLRTEVDLHPTRREYVAVGRNRVPEVTPPINDFSGTLRVESQSVSVVPVRTR